MPAQPPFVAVIDDEEPIRKALCRLLRASGLHAEGFASGQFFLDSGAALRAECLVLDLHMPGLSGLQLLKQLELLGTLPPTIIITGYDEPDTREHCLAAGAASYLRKPIDEQSLLEAIDTAVCKQRVAQGH
jgi:FixJ family two-component response regulator